MVALFRFLHIINLVFLVGTSGTYAFSNNGLFCEFWLVVYQLCFGIIQLLSLRFFTSGTKTKVVLYWAFTGLWIFIAIYGTAIKGSCLVTVYIIPLIITCYSVYVSWHTLKDLINYKP